MCVVWKILNFVTWHTHYPKDGGAYVGLNLWCCFRIFYLKKKKKMSLNFDSREKIYTTTCFARRWELQHLYNSYFNSTKQPTNIKGKYYIHIDVLRNILSRNFTIIRNHVSSQIFLLECSQYTYLLCIQTQMLELFSRQLKISQLQ